MKNLKIISLVILPAVLSFTSVEAGLLDKIGKILTKEGAKAGAKEGGLIIASAFVGACAAVMVEDGTWLCVSQTKDPKTGKVIEECEEYYSVDKDKKPVLTKRVCKKFAN